MDGTFRSRPNDKGLGLFGSLARRAGKAFKLLWEWIRLPFDGDYRIFFQNFWYGGEEQAHIWFYPVIVSLYSRLDPSRACRLSRASPHLGMLSVLGDARKIEGVRAQRKVFFTGECVRPKGSTEWSIYSDYRLDGVDLAIGFDFEESVQNPKYLRFPLWIMYLFTGLEEKDEVAAKVAKLNECRFPKSKFCALVARHDKNGIRTRMYEAISRIGKVDCAGPWNRNDSSLIEDFGDDKQRYLKQYQFNICPENTQGEGYVTEKLFQSFQSGCIPIYNGYCDDPEPFVVDKNAFIFWSEGGDNHEAVERVRRLHSDAGEYERFLRRPPFKADAVDFIWESLERLRSRLGAILPVKISRSIGRT